MKSTMEDAWRTRRYWKVRWIYVVMEDKDSTRRPDRKITVRKVSNIAITKMNNN